MENRDVVYIIKIAQFDFLSVSRARSVIHRLQSCEARYTEPQSHSAAHIN